MQSDVLTQNSCKQWAATITKKKVEKVISEKRKDVLHSSQKPEKDQEYQEKRQWR